MKITEKWLKEQSACTEGTQWFLAQKETDSVKVLRSLIKEGKLDWAHWTICRVFNRKQKIRYAIYAAEQVIDLYEKEYPDDKRPRNSIESAKAVLKSDTAVTRAATRAAAEAAWTARLAAGDARAAAEAAWAAAEAAWAAAWDAGAAAWAARAAAEAAWAAAEAARLAAGDAAGAARAAAGDAAGAAMKTKILNYGIGLLEGKKGKI